MTPSRRDFLALSIRSAALVALGGGAAALATRRSHDGGLWQIDPAKCIACGKCATSCVLKPSAARCFHTFEMCGYCNLCTGYFQPDADTGAAVPRPRSAPRVRSSASPWLRHTTSTPLIRPRASAAPSAWMAAPPTAMVPCTCRSARTCASDAMSALLPAIAPRARSLASAVPTPMHAGASRSREAA